MRALAACLLLVSCREKAPPPPVRLDLSAGVEARPVDGNLISNAGFEGALAPWFAPPNDPAWVAGEVLTGAAHGGTHALLARLRGEAGSHQERRWGGLYEVGAVPFPRQASLWYRVDRWEAGNALQYLLFAVLVGSGDQTYQLRYFLAGPEAIPYNEKGNVRYLLVHKGAPPTGRWIRFSADLHRDFQERWGRVPRNFERLRFAIEARYDTRGEPLDRAVAADVWFDDVFVGNGPATAPPSGDAAAP